MGRSDIFLKLEIIKKTIGMVVLVAALVLFDSPIAIALTGAVTTFSSCFINAYPNKKLIDYSYPEQMKDILPSFLISLAMLGIVLQMGKLDIPVLLLLVTQVMVGVLVYVLISAVVRPEPFRMLLDLLKNKKAK